MEKHVASEHLVKRPRGSQYQDIRRQEPPVGSWQERINLLIARNTLPKSHILDDSSNKNALEKPLSQLAAIVSLPSLPNKSAPYHGTIESRPAGKEYIENQEIGLLQTIKAPGSAPPPSRSTSTLISTAAARLAPQRPNPRWTPHQLFPSASELLKERTNAMAPQGSNKGLQDSRWSAIPEGQHDVAIAKLRRRVHSGELLKKLGYFRSNEDNRFQSAPPASPFHPKRRAVALDCEMVGCRYGNREHSVLARLSVIDYLTGETIIDSLVEPKMRVTDWRTRYSGVTAAAMNAAVRAGKALRGHEEAWKALWKHIDSETVIVGQSLTNDLEALKVTHSCLVDSGIVTAEATKISGQTLIGLKIACRELLKIEIQQSWNKGHDSVEDSFAAREVVLFCLNETEKLEQWAVLRRSKEAERLAKIEKQRREALERGPWTKEEWPRPVKYDRRNIVVQLPHFENMLVRDRYEHYEIDSILPSAIWATTLLLSKEEFIKLVEEAKEGEARKPRVKLPPLVSTSNEEQPDHEAWKESVELQKSNHIEAPQQLVVELFSDTPQTILDQPLDFSEESYLTAPLMPYSPNSKNQPVVRRGSWDILLA